MPTPKIPPQRDRVRENSSSRSFRSPMVASPYGESPKFVNRETGFGEKSLDMTKTSRSSLGLSLSQAKIDRWTMGERIQLLETQLEDREHVLRENMDLKERVRVTEHEHSRLREKFSELNAKVRDFMHREESEEKTSKILMERDQMVHENSRLRRDLDLVQAELSRVRELSAETIDRKIHERLLNDLKVENEKLRRSLEESVPRTVHDRIFIQYQESSQVLLEKSRETVHLEREVSRYMQRLKNAEETEASSRNIIANLKDELVEMERANDRFSRRLIELERLVGGSKNKEKDALNELDSMRSELSDAQKRMNALLTELTVKTENEKRLGLEASLLNQSMEIAKSDTSKMLTRLGSMKEELKILKLAVQNDRSEFGECIKSSIAEIQDEFQSNIKQLIHGVWKLLTHFRLVDDSWEKPSRVTDLVLVLKAALAASSNELLKCINECDIAKSDAAHLLETCTEKDEQIRKLSYRLSALESNRANEDMMMSKLRKSIETAESKLSNRPRAQAKLDYKLNSPVA